MNYLHFTTMKSAPDIRILPVDEIGYRPVEAPRGKTLLVNYPWPLI